MFLEAFLYNVLMVLIVAPAGAAVMAALALLTTPWREVLKGWCYLTGAFIALGLLASLPSLLTGDRAGSNPSDCPGAKYGYSCH